MISVTSSNGNVVPPKTWFNEVIYAKIIPFDEFDRMIKANQFHLIIGIVAWYRAREDKLIDY